MIFKLIFRLAAFATLALVGAGAVQAAPVFEDNMAQRAKACTVCHGEQGRAGPDGYYPRLAGKPAGYLFNQLQNVRDGRRHYALMRGLLEPLSDDYLWELAQYFSALHVPYPAPQPSTAAPAVLARGRTLALDGDASRAIAPCQQCHGKALTGAAPHVPGLLGLPRAYLNAQLGAWRTQARQAHAPDCMADIAKGLSETDVAALTHWLAAQPVPADAKPLPSLPPLPVGAKEIRCGSNPLPTESASKPPPALAHTAQAAITLVAQGEYLARAGNCEACHTRAGGTPYAGNRPVETPFGTVYSSNLTSDRSTGIGRWTDEDFWQALHHGKGKDGQLLNPAFPYTSYTHITRDDSDALFAYLQTLPAVSEVRREHALRWPYGTQAALRVWRTLYFTATDWVPQAGQSAQWNRGAYLVQGLGHCAECHSPRNALGGIASDKLLGGGVMVAQNWLAPSLRDVLAAGIAKDQIAATATLLKTGVAAHGLASGPMAQVVQGSTQYLKDQDVQAMVVYLASLAQVPTPATAPSKAHPTKPTAPASTLGAKLYAQHCADCHGTEGQGVARAYPALAGNRALNGRDARNAINAVLFGGFGSATAANPRPFGMPPFVLQLNDAEIAAVLTHVQSSWGNQGSMVAEQDVVQARKSVAR